MTIIILSCRARNLFARSSWLFPFISRTASSTLRISITVITISYTSSTSAVINIKLCLASLTFSGRGTSSAIIWAISTLWSLTIIILSCRARNLFARSSWLFPFISRTASSTLISSITVITISYTSSTSAVINIKLCLASLTFSGRGTSSTIIWAISTLWSLTIIILSCRARNLFARSSWLFPLISRTASSTLISSITVITISYTSSTSVVINIKLCLASLTFSGRGTSSTIIWAISTLWSLTIIILSCRARNLFARSSWLFPFISRTASSTLISSITVITITYTSSTSAVINIKLCLASLTFSGRGTSSTIIWAISTLWSLTIIILSCRARNLFTRSSWLFPLISRTASSTLISSITVITISYTSSTSAVINIKLCLASLTFSGRGTSSTIIWAISTLWSLTIIILSCRARNLFARSSWLFPFISRTASSTLRISITVITISYTSSTSAVINIKLCLASLTFSGRGTSSTIIWAISTLWSLTIIILSCRARNLFARSSWLFPFISRTASSTLISSITVITISYTSSTSAVINIKLCLASLTFSGRGTSSTIIWAISTLWSLTIIILSCRARNLFARSSWLFPLISRTASSTLISSITVITISYTSSTSVVINIKLCLASLTFSGRGTSSTIIWAISTLWSLTIIILSCRARNLFARSSWLFPFISRTASSTLISSITVITITYTSSTSAVINIKLCLASLTFSGRGTSSTIIWAISTLWSLTIIILSCRARNLFTRSSWLFPFISRTASSTLISSITVITISYTSSTSAVIYIKLCLASLTFSGRGTSSTIIWAISTLWSLTIIILSCRARNLFARSSWLFPFISRTASSTLISSITVITISYTSSTSAVINIKLCLASLTFSGRGTSSTIIWAISTLWSLTIIILSCRARNLFARSSWLFPLISRTASSTLKISITVITITYTSSTSTVINIKLNLASLTFSGRGTNSTIIWAISTLWSLSIIILSCRARNLFARSSWLFPLISRTASSTLISSITVITISYTSSTSAVINIKLCLASLTFSGRGTSSTIIWAISTLWSLSIIILSFRTLRIWIQFSKTYKLNILTSYFCHLIFHLSILPNI